MTFPLSPIEFPEQRPNPDRPKELAKAISTLSRFPIYRAFMHIRTVTAAYTMDPVWDRIVLADATTAPFNVTLPLATDADAAEYVVVRLNAGANAVTVVPGSGTINGTGAWAAANWALNNQGDLVRAASDGANFYVTGRHP